MRRVKRVLFPFLLLLLFATYQVGITMFTHVHYVNGVMIAHSHPNKGKHTHSTTAIVVIGRLVNFQSLEATDTAIDIEPMRPLLCYVQVQAKVPVVAGTHLQVLSLRAPPEGIC